MKVSLMNSMMADKFSPYIRVCNSFFNKKVSYGIYFITDRNDVERKGREKSSGTERSL